MQIQMQTAEQSQNFMLLSLGWIQLKEQEGTLKAVRRAEKRKLRKEG